jgi:16S rRNA (cytidine1402-2'-O)-methyltransferase
VDHYAVNEPRGEYVLVVGGAARREGPALTMEEGVARVLALREAGMRMKDAVRQVSADTGLNKNDLYDAALKA